MILMMKNLKMKNKMKIMKIEIENPGFNPGFFLLYRKMLQENIRHDKLTMLSMPTKPRSIRA